MLKNIRIVVSRRQRMPNKMLAEVALHFEAGAFAGMKLEGFGIWTSRDSDEPWVAMPSREYKDKDGNTKRWALLRPQDSDDRAAGRELREEILAAYRDFVANGGGHRNGGDQW